MNPSPTSYDSEDSEDIVGWIRHLVDGQRPGVLTTVDAEGRPQARWMASLSFQDLPCFHTLTAATSRKVDQIERHPEVNWMFSNDDRSLVLNLIGRASVLRDSRSLSRIWKQVKDKSQAYFLKNCSEGPGFVVIETRVERVEGCTPRNQLRFAVDADVLRALQ